MSNLQWYDYLRMCTIFLALIALYISMNRARKSWNTFTERLKELWWAMNALLILLVEGSVEQIIDNTHWGPRTLLGFLVAIVCVRAQLRNEGYVKAD